MLETLAAQVGEADRTHVDAVTVAWEAWMRAFFRHACYLGYRSGLFCLEQASLDQGLPEMMEQVIRTEYALGITLPQCQQELHRELRMRHRKAPSPEPSTEDGERKHQGQTDSLTGLPHLCLLYTSTTVSYLMGLDSDTSEKSLSAIIGEEAIQMILDNDEKTRIVKWIATQDPEVLSLVHWISLQDRDTLIRLDQILSLSRKQ